jgi:hypothetical protein
MNPGGGAAGGVQRRGTNPYGPGGSENPSQAPNYDPNDPQGTDFYGRDGGSKYFGTGPGHAEWINKNRTGISGPMVRPADRDSAALWAGPFQKWGEGGASGNRQLAGGRVYNALTDLQDNPDLSADVKNAMTTKANEASNAQFASAEGRLNRYGRTTGNRAGNAAAVAQMATAKADTAAGVNRENVLDFERERFARKKLATEGLAALYNNEGNFLSGMFGARGALSAKPLSGKNQSGGHGNYIGTNLGFSIG